MLLCFLIAHNTPKHTKIITIIHRAEHIYSIQILYDIHKSSCHECDNKSKCKSHSLHLRLFTPRTPTRLDLRRRLWSVCASCWSRDRGGGTTATLPHARPADGAERGPAEDAFPLRSSRRDSSAAAPSRRRDRRRFGLKRQRFPPPSRGVFALHYECRPGITLARTSAHNKNTNTHSWFKGIVHTRWN